MESKKTLEWWKDTDDIEEDLTTYVLQYLESGILTFKPFDTITFSNGYSKTRDQFEIEKLNINIDTGNPKWGAEPNKRYFVLTLGKIIKPL